MPVLGHCVMGLPVIDHSTFTFTGSSFRTASPNVKRGMAATSSVAFGTSSGLPVATSFMPPASLTPSPTCPTWPQNAARYAPTAVAYVPFSVRMKPPMFCTIIACSAPAYSFAMRSMSAAGTPHSSSAAARSHADASAHDQLELGLVGVGRVGAVQREGRLDAALVVRHHLAALLVEHDERRGVVGVLQHGLARRAVHEARRARVREQELLVVEPLVHDDLEHGQAERRVGAGPGLQPVGGLGGRLGVDGVDHHELAAVLHHVLEALEVALLRDGGVVAPHHDVGAVLDLVAAVEEALAVDGHDGRRGARAAQRAHRGRRAAQVSRRTRWPPGRAWRRSCRSR